MRARHRSSTNVQRRTHPLVNAKLLRSRGRAHDVHHRIGCAHLVKMNRVDRRPMNLCFRRPQGLKHADSGLFCACGDRGSRDDVSNLLEPPSMFVLVLLRDSCRPGLTATLTMLDAPPMRVFCVRTAPFMTVSLMLVLLLPENLAR